MEEAAHKQLHHIKTMQAAAVAALKNYCGGSKSRKLLGKVIAVVDTLCGDFGFGAP